MTTTTTSMPKDDGGGLGLGHLIRSNWTDAEIEVKNFINFTTNAAANLTTAESNNYPARFNYARNNGTFQLEPIQIVDHLAADQFAAIPVAGASAPQETPMLKLVHDYLLVILLVSVMFSMGCGVTVKEVWNHLMRPTAVAVCLIAQFFIVPFIAYCLIVSLNLDVLHATGLLILACCPGGVTSNIFTYVADGDLSLSITMTSVATIAALLLMPLNVWLYGRNLETASLVIPYAEMTGTLVVVTIPVLIGMYLNYRFPTVTPYITKIGVFSGFGIICFCQTLEIVIFPTIFVGVPATLYAAVILLPFVSFFVGIVFAKICRLNERVARTIGIEIGIKNVGSALTIVSLSFSIEQLKKAWVFPFLYAFSSFLVIFIVIIGYKWIVKWQQSLSNDGNNCGEKVKTTDDQDDEEENNNGKNKKNIQSSDKYRIKIEEELEGLTGGNMGEEMKIVKTMNGRILLSTCEKV